MTKRFECIGENMEVSLKDTESEMSDYPFSLCCESVDDFETLVQECLQLVGLLNTLHEENEELRQTTKTQQIRIYCQDKEIQKLNEQLNKIPNTIKEVWIE